MNKMKNREIRQREMNLQQKRQIALYQKMETKQVFKRSLLAMKELKTNMRRCMKGVKTRTQ